MSVICERTDLKYIVISVNRRTNVTTVEVPTPENGVLKPEDRKDAAGRTASVIPFDQATPEQKAYYVFWSQGTQERINALNAGGDPMASKSTLIWLVRLRMMDVEQKTGFKYGMKLREIWDEAKT